jgi:hypothetical protein
VSGKRGRTISRYGTSLRKREDSANWKRKHQILPCGEVTLEKTADLSWGRLRHNERPQYPTMKSLTRLQYWQTKPRLPPGEFVIGDAKWP